MKERPDLRADQAAGRIEERQRDVFFWRAAYRRLKQRRFTGVLMVRFVDGEIEGYRLDEAPGIRL